jgi:hypothetical protein
MGEGEWTATYFSLNHEGVSPRTGQVKTRTLCSVYSPGAMAMISSSKTKVTKLIILITFIASSRKLIPDTVSVFIFNTFSSVYTYETHISCPIHQRFPGTQERNAHLLGPAPASKMKMKYQLTLIQHPAISSMRFSSLAHKAAVHCGAVTLVGSVRTRDL